MLIIKDMISIGIPMTAIKNSDIKTVTIISLYLLYHFSKHFAIDKVLI